MEKINPGSSNHLVIISREDFPLPDSDYITLLSITDGAAVVIHYPAIGFTAGLTASGEKIPPIWRDPNIFTKEQRTQFLQQAADNLMQILAAHLHDRNGM